MSGLIHDLRYALRQLRKNPGFTAVAVVTLALGIGANTAIFSVVDAIFLRPLPFSNSKRIYVVSKAGTQIGGFSISFPIFLAWQHQKDMFEHLALLRWNGDSNLAGAGGTDRIPSVGVSTELFSALGVRPALGRDFLPQEGEPGGRPVALLSDGFWRGRFGADNNVLGRAITLNGESYTVVGVLPHGFEIPIPGMRGAEVWLPIQVPFTSDDPSYGALLCVGLLKANVTVAQTEAALTSPLAQLQAEFPNMFAAGERAHLQPLRSFLAEGAGTAPLLLFGAVAVVLLIACMNVANLTLARSTARQREIAIRTVIGAGRTRLVRQLLTESLLLAILGGTLGVLACYASFDLIRALVPANIPHVGEFLIDGQVLLFSLLLSMVTGVLFGLMPALGASRADLYLAMKVTSPQSCSGGDGRLRRVLAVGEVAMSLMLLLGAALSLESLARLLRVQPGFDPSNSVTFKASLSSNKYDTPAKRTEFFDRAIAGFQTLPGVEQAALVNVLPLEGGPDLLFSIEGGSRAAGEALDANYRVASPEYFRTLRIPLKRGHSFFASDNSSTEPVVIINQTMATMFWSGKDPIGERIWIGKPMGPAWTEPAPRKIAGIVGDIREATLASPPEPTMYIPYAQAPQTDEAYFVVRAQRVSLIPINAFRSALQAIDRDVAVTEFKTMEEVVSQSLTDWRFHAILLGAFGGLALFLAAIGVYGVISYSVAQRTHEIGIRLALGARRDDVLRLVIRQGVKLAFVGIAVGIAAALAWTRLIASLLYGVTANDPVTFAGVAILLTFVAVAACYIPARRAAKVDPMVALRYE